MAVMIVESDKPGVVQDIDASTPLLDRTDCIEFSERLLQALSPTSHEPGAHHATVMIHSTIRSMTIGELERSIASTTPARPLPGPLVGRVASLEKYVGDQAYSARKAIVMFLATKDGHIPIILQNDRPGEKLHADILEPSATLPQGTIYIVPA